MRRAARMGEKGTAEKVLVGKPEGQRQLRRLILRWEGKGKKKVKLSLQQAVKAHRVVRRRSSHIIYAIVSQMAVRLSALSACCSFPFRKIPGTHFCQRLSQPQGHSAAGRIR
jgi:hypothetical protein